MLLITVILAVLFASPNQASSLRAVCVTDSVRQLTEQLYTSRLPSGSNFGDAVTSSAMDLRLRELIRKHHRVTATPDDDANWVLVQVSVADLLSDLKKSKADNQLRPPLISLADASFVAIGLSVGTAPVPGDAPIGWETVSSNGIVMSIETAQADAMRQIIAAHQSAGVSPAGSTEALQTQVTSAAPILHASQVCTVTVPFELNGVEYEAIGFGIPPWSQVRTRSQRNQRIAPAWASQTFVATGRGTTVSATSNKRERAVACSTAKANALIKIASKVDELSTAAARDSTIGDSTIGAYIKHTPQFDSAWSAFLKTARLTQTDFADGVCSVEMTLDLSGLWHLYSAIEHFKAPSQN